MVKSSYMLVLVIPALVFTNQNDEEPVESHTEYVPKPIVLVINKNCRNRRYPRSRKQRFTVPDHKILWNVTWDEYDPPFYNAIEVQSDNTDLGTPGIDFKVKWNEIDNQINRVSFYGKYDVRNSIPINPHGRTGMTGKGALPRWGPNHWVHLLITKLRKNRFDQLIFSKFNNKPLLDIVAIRSFDQLLWAVPGRMAYAGESLQNSARRVYYKGVGAIYNSCKSPSEEKIVRERINEFFEHGKIMYQGYVDDHRNTDNAWVETTVVHYHDSTGDIVGNVTLFNSDNIVVKWVKLSTKLRWIARHFGFMINLTTALLGADLSGAENCTENL